MKHFVIGFVIALACATLGCGASTRGSVTFARAHGDLDPTGLRLRVKTAEVEGRADGTVRHGGKTILLFSKSEVRFPADDASTPNPLLFTVSGDDVEGNGKRGKFDPNDDALTFNGLTITIRDNVPTIAMSGYHIPTKMKFEAIPDHAKRAALLLSLFILSMSVHLEEQDKSR